MPSLNPRTPSPSPRMSSGILRPPKSTRITMATINKCMGLSHIGHLPFAPGSPETEAARNTRFLSQYNTLVPGPAGHPLAVKVLKQWDGVLPGDSCQILEHRHGDSF